MPRAFDRTTNWIVDYPWATFVLIVLVTALATLGHTAPETITGLFKPAPETEPHTYAPSREAFAAPPDIEQLNLTDANAIIVVQSNSFFTPAGTEAMRHVVHELESLEHVQDVLWLDRVPMLNIFGLREPLLPRSSASPERFLAARDKALEHPLVRGQLLSGDGRTLLLLVNFDWLFVQSDDDCTVRLRQVAERAAAEFPAVHFTFQVTGEVPILIAAVQSHEKNQLKFQIIGYSMIAVMAVILFRGIVAVLIVALAPALGVYWTVGIVRFLPFDDNPFNDVIMPVLISLVGLTDGVHLMVQIRRFRAAGSSARDAARAGLREVGFACGLTSLTTAIGFASLGFAHHEVVREFGICCVIGVAIAFVAVVTSIPLACSTWLGSRVHVGHEHGLIDRHLSRIGLVIDYVLARPGRVSAIGIVTTALLTLVALTLRPDERNANALPDGSEATEAMRHLDGVLGGLEFGNVDVRWSSAVSSDSPEVLEAISKVDDLLRSEELIGHPLSIRNLLDALPGAGDPADRVSLMELLPPPLKRAFYTPEYRQATVTFRVQDLGIARYSPVFERIESGLKAIAAEHPGFDFRISGSAEWRWRKLYQIVVDLAASLGTASLVIFSVLGLVYRSVRIGLIAVIPNVFPLALTGTYLVLTGQALELVSVCAFTVCLGIAVDDTIHFLSRFEEERRRSADDHEAIRRAFTGVGTALIMTTVILVAGFSTVLLSDSHDHRTFATMGGLTIASALFGDLVFLPALLARFARRAPNPSS